MNDPASDDISRLKHALRQEVLSRRDGLDPHRRIEGSLAAATHAKDCRALGSALEPGTIVSGFLPIRSEIDARPLMAALAERGARLCVPVVLDKMTIEFRELVRGAPLVESGFGTVGPGADAAVVDPHVMLVPLAAFDRAGGRMGYGAGHYDRAIARLCEKGRTPTLIGLAFALQEVQAVPMEAHDRRLHGILTDEGCIEMAE